MPGAARSKSGGVVISHDIRGPVIVRPTEPNPDITDRFDRFEVSTKTWVKLSSMSKARAGHCLHSYYGQIIAVGGTDGSTIHKSVESYDIDTDDWTTVASMSLQRAYFQSVEAGGLIYVFGGITVDARGNISITTTSEAYSPDNDTWTTIAPMPEGYGIAFGVASYSPLGYIYVLSGYRNAIGTLNTFSLRYDIDNDEWDTPVEFVNDAAKLYARILPFIFTEDDYIYVIDGLRYTFGVAGAGDPILLFDSYRYDMLTDSIERSERHFRDLPQSRFAGGSASIGLTHFFIGGANADSNTLRAVEQVTTGVTPFGYEQFSKMANGRSSFGCTPSFDAYGDYVYAGGGVISHNDQNFLRVTVNAVPERIRLDGKQTGAVSISVADENGDYPAEVIVRVYTQYTATDGSNVILTTHDDVTVLNGSGMTTLLPRSEDAGGITMTSGDVRSYDIGVYGVVIDGTYAGESGSVEIRTSTSSGGSSSGGGSGVGAIVVPDGVKQFAAYQTVTDADQSTTGSILNLGFLSNFLSFKPIGDSGKSAAVTWFSDIEWLPVVSPIIDDNEGTYDRISDSLDRMSRQDVFGGSMLLDTVKLAGEILELDSNGVGKIVYVESDGDDNASHYSSDEVLAELERVAPINKIPIVSSGFRVIPQALHLDKSSRDGSAVLDAFALSTGGTTLYLTGEEDVAGYAASVITSKGFAGYGVFTFEIDLAEECRIETIGGTFSVDGIETSAAFRYSIGDADGLFGLYSDRADSSETVTLQNSEGRYIKFMVEFFAAMTLDEYNAGLLVPPLMSEMLVTYHKKTTSYLFVTPETTPETPHQVMVAFDAVRGRGSEVNVGATTQNTGSWDDYGSPAKPAVDNGTKIVIPIRQSVGNDATYTLEPLISIDGFIFEATYGKWAGDSEVRVYTSTGTEIEVGQYKAFPHKGYVVFNKKRTGDYIISVKNKSELSVAAEIVNRVHGDPVKIYGGGFMYSTLELRRLSQSGTVLPEAINLLLTPLKPSTSSTFSANYTYYDVTGRAEKGTTIRWYINDVEQVDLENLRQWINPDWQLAKTGDVVYFSIEPRNAQSVGRTVKSVPVRLG